MDDVELLLWGLHISASLHQETPLHCSFFRLHQRGQGKRLISFWDGLSPELASNWVRSFHMKTANELSYLSLHNCGL